MIPLFDINGNLPPGCYKPDLKEFEEHFVNSFPHSSSRSDIYEGYIDFSILLCDEMPSAKKQIINGSFTTDKLDPNDIDMVIVFDSEALTSSEKNKCPHLMNNLTIIQGYNCHSFPLVKFPESKPELYEKYLEKKAYWTDCWGSDRDDNPKGLIDLNMDKNCFIRCKK
ncbi:MAG: hypothetical protein U1C19_06190 [Methanobacteriaceae archaeon]|jgi:hypothetical protein|nr:hypothetical protein [Methanobacteriaceae archaeon]